MSKEQNRLQDWMDTATAGLPPSAAGKFRAEIADHAAEARAKHIAAGMGEDEAERAAIADLGDAGKVARRFRDIHFTRSEYSRGATTLWALLLISLAGMGAAILSDPLNEAHVPNLFSRWTWIFNFASAVSSVTLLFAAGRAVITLLKEQYDVTVSRPVRVVLAGGLLAALPAGLLIPALVWGLNFSPFVRQLRYSAVSDAAFSVLPALQVLRAAAFIVIGIMGIGFAVRHLGRKGARVQPGLAMLAMIGGLIGVVLAISGGVMAAAVFAAQPYPQNDPLILLMNTLSVTLAILFVAPQLVLLSLFTTMRRTGTALSS